MLERIVDVGLIVAADGFEGLFDKVEEGTLLSLGEMSCHTVGATVDETDSVAQFSPNFNNRIFILFA